MQTSPILRQLSMLIGRISSAGQDEHQTDVAGKPCRLEQWHQVVVDWYRDNDHRPPSSIPQRDT
jgi:hypothetical protein